MIRKRVYLCKKGTILIVLNLYISDESETLICPQPCACFSDFSGRNHPAWLYSGRTLEERGIHREDLCSAMPRRCVRLCASVWDSHLCEGSTPLRHRRLKSQWCRGLQMESRVLTSQQSEGTCQHTWHYYFYELCHQIYTLNRTKLQMLGNCSCFFMQFCHYREKGNFYACRLIQQCKYNN